MAHPTPHVEQGTLTLTRSDGAQTIAVGTPAWFAWLETATSFMFVGAHGTFTARRERASSGRGAWYWRAYHHRGGERKRAYLGRPEELSLERLHTVAAQLAESSQTPQVHNGTPAAAPGRSDARPPAGGASAPLLLATKLFTPRVPPQLVARPRLESRLDAGLSGALTLVCAPAGFGKTTLLAAWLRHTGRPTAWLSIDARDNDLTTLLRYLAAALQTLAPAVGVALTDLLRSPTPPPTDMLLTSLLNDLTALPHGCILVLDDYHVLEAPAIHQAISFLIDHASPALHLVIATREDPPLPLARLRARRQVAEVRADQLRFKADETAAFLKDVMGLALRPDDAAALEARTEGWIAGLQMAAIALRDLDDQAGFIAAFTGSNRFIVDYLVDEVLTRQPPHIQTFLLQTSILDRLCGPLCDTVLLGDAAPVAGQTAGGDGRMRAVAPEAYSQRLLEHLDRANLFVSPLDAERRWYRYHHLFAGVLRERLGRGMTEGALATLHDRASRWYEAQRLIPEAIQHALRGRDIERAAHLIERHGAALVVSGHVETVLGWLNALPDALVVTRPTLCITHALALMFTNFLEQAEARLVDAERALEAGATSESREQTLGRVAVTRANLARYYGDLERGVALAYQALELLPASDVMARAPALVAAARSFLVSGDVTPSAERLVAATVAPAHASGNVLSMVASITILARLQTLQGRLGQAAATYAEVLRLTPGSASLLDLQVTTAYFFGLGDIQRERNELEAAERLVAQGMNLIRDRLGIDADIITMGYHTLAQLQQARGDTAGALTTLDAFARLARQRRFVPLMVARGAAARAQVQLAHGDLAAADRWAADCGLSSDDAVLPYYREGEYLLLARVLIAQGRRASAQVPLRDAVRLLERLFHAAEACGRVDSMLKIAILLALAHQALGQAPEAHAALDGALALGAPEGYIRPFVDEGAPMATLLRAAQGSRALPAYCATLLAAFPEMNDVSDVGDSLVRAVQGQRVSATPSPQPPSPLVEPLTAREVEILRLIADGASNAEIARRLIISLGTAKKHTSNILGKLQVQSRTQAIARARELNLL